MSAEKAEQQPIEGTLPDEQPRRESHRSRLQLTGEVGGWDREAREQVGAVLHGLEQNFDLLSGLPESAREDAIREVGFLTGPVMREKILAVRRRHKGEAGQASEAATAPEDAAPSAD